MKKISLFFILLIIIFSSSIIKAISVPVTGVSLDNAKMTIEVGESKTIVAKVIPNGATNKNIVWVSSNTSIARVSNGKVTGVKAGIAIVTAKSVDGNKQARCIVTVKASTIQVSSVKINKSKITLKQGESTNLIATVVPTNATNKNVIWTSSNTKIAKVVNGKVTALNPGGAVILVKSVDGNKTSFCYVTVKANATVAPTSTSKPIPTKTQAPTGTTVKVTGVKLDKNRITLKKRESVTLKTSITPTNSTIKDVIWNSSNTNVAKVSNGKVTAKKDGSAIITVTTKDGNKKAYCYVTVNSPISNVDCSKAEYFTGGARIYDFSDDELLVANETSYNPSTGKDGQIYVRKNKNGSLRNWGTKVKASFAPGYACANINFFEYNGVLYMAYRATGKTSNQKQFYSGLYVSYSTDKGNTWKHHSIIIQNLESASKYRGVWEPVLGKMNGKLAVFYSNDSTSANSSGQNVEFKIWNGSNWGERHIAFKNGSNRPGMPVWQQLDDGTILVAIENNTVSGYGFVIQMACSLDKNGTRWSNLKNVYVPTKRGRMANAPSLVVLPKTKRIVVGFHTAEDLSSDAATGPMKLVYTDVSASTIVSNLKANKEIKDYFKHKQNIFGATAKNQTDWGAMSYINGYLYINGGGPGGKIKRIRVE